MTKCKDGGDCGIGGFCAPRPMTKVKTWAERCEEHPEHEGIVTEAMIRQRMQEEIDDLRALLSNYRLCEREAHHYLHESRRLMDQSTASAHAAKGHEVIPLYAEAREAK